MKKFSVIVLMFLLVACKDNLPVEMPPAQKLTREANGYYCLMTLVSHKGPKAQIILTDSKVLWFTSVREAISFTLSPGEPKNIAAIYVNDMSNANWDKPGVDNWIDAHNAWFVLGSDHLGGMNTPEAVPFKKKAKADLFASKQGGTIYTFSSIPADYITSSSSE